LVIVYSSTIEFYEAEAYEFPSNYKIMATAEYWIEKLDLTAHPEGGYFSEIYRSDDVIKKSGLPMRYPEDRSMATLIYYLLKDDNVSAFHRLRSDELWIHVDGGTLDIHQIGKDGSYTCDQLDKDIGAPVCVIKHGAWFGASLTDTESFCLCTCMVTPGFDFADFEMADPGQLKKICPAQSDIIDRLSR